MVFNIGDRVGIGDVNIVAINRRRTVEVFRLTNINRIAAPGQLRGQADDFAVFR